MENNKIENRFIAIDMKSFYASVECVARGLDPLKANLLVAYESRSDQTICLAVSPALKAIGVPGRPRLFEAKRAIADYERRLHAAMLEARARYGNNAIVKGIINVIDIFPL